MLIKLCDSFDEYLDILREQVKLHGSSLKSKNDDSKLITGFESPDGWWGIGFDLIKVWAAERNHVVVTYESLVKLLNEAIKEAIEGERLMN